MDTTKEQKNQMNALQFIKFDRRSGFLEISGDSFGIDKIRLGFRTYDMTKEAGSRIAQSIDIYLDFAEALSLCDDILDPAYIEKATGKLQSRLVRKIADNTQLAQELKKYPEPGFLSMGGTNAKVLGAKRKSRPDGMSISRQFLIEAGGKVPYLFKALMGPGEADAKGLIVPRYNGSNAEAKVTIAMNETDLRKFALVVKAQIEAHFAMQSMLKEEIFAKTVTESITNAVLDESFIKLLRSAFEGRKAS